MCARMLNKKALAYLLKEGELREHVGGLLLVARRGDRDRQAVTELRDQAQRYICREMAMPSPEGLAFSLTRSIVFSCEAFCSSTSPLSMKVIVMASLTAFCFES